MTSQCFVRPGLGVIKLTGCSRLLRVAHRCQPGVGKRSAVQAYEAQFQLVRKGAKGAWSAWAAVIAAAVTVRWGSGVRRM